MILKNIKIKKAHLSSISSAASFGSQGARPVHQLRPTEASSHPPPASACRMRGPCTSFGPPKPLFVRCRLRPVGRAAQLWSVVITSPANRSSNLELRIFPMPPSNPGGFFYFIFFKNKNFKNICPF